MEFDLSDQPEIVQQVFGYAQQGYDLAMGWLLSPAAWSQFALLMISYFLAVMVARRLRPADRAEFPFDVTALDWRSYVADTHVPGLRRWTFATYAGKAAETYKPAIKFRLQAPQTQKKASKKAASARR